MGKEHLLDYVTTDKTGLVKFTGLGTGREILLNADPEGRIVVLHAPSEEVVKEAIEEYYSMRIQHWWDEIAMSVVVDRRRLEAHQRNELFLNGFSRRVISPSKESFAFTYLRHPLIRQHLPENLGAEITSYCLSLPLDEQRALLTTLRPTNFDDLLTVMPSWTLGRVLQLDFIKCLRRVHSLPGLLDILFDSLHNRESPLIKQFYFNWAVLSPASRIFELLSWFNQKRWILLNKKALMTLRSTKSAGSHYPQMAEAVGTQVYWNEESVKLARGIIEEHQLEGNLKTEAIGMYLRVCLLLRSTTIESIGDFSPELLTYNDEQLELPSSYGVNVKVRRLNSAIVRLFKKDDRYSHVTFPVTKRTEIGRPRAPKSKAWLRTHGSRWILKTHPELEKWVELFEEYKTIVKLQCGGRLNAAFNRWLEFLSELSYPPLKPEAVDRARHIKNVWNPSVKTYWRYLELITESPATKNYMLMTMRRFFDYYRDRFILDYQKRRTRAPQFVNPIKADDGWAVNNKRKTHRHALGIDLVTLLQEILLDRDQDGNPTFNWAKNHPTFSRDWRYEVDPETKETKKVWWPGRAVAMYMLLELPLRSSQVLWLDEGLGDEYTYDFDTLSLIPNHHASAERGRREGVFRLIEDPFHSSSFLGLWVNTNKTKQYDPTVARGYEIPWPNDELFSMLRIMKEWNKQYFPNPSPVTIADDSSASPTEAVKSLLPKFYPLFRDKSGEQGRNPNLPFDYQKLRRMWDYLLAEAEDRLKKQGRQIELVEWRTLSSGAGHTYEAPKARYDLHSLRITGITSLAEKGVPIHLISEHIVGHSTIIMTLYYEKTSPLKVREMLRRAQEEAEADLDGLLALLDEMDDPESILVWNNLHSENESALQALKANKGLWQVDLAGICPGTICEEGGQLDVNGHATAVPAGACGLCRYYVTGPAFLYGQMQRLNNLMYSMREKGEELVALRRKIYDLEEGGSNRPLVEARGRRDRINRELKDMTHEWCNRYRLFQSSLAMLDQYQEKKRKVARGTMPLMPLLTANTQDGFKPVVAEATNVGLVRQISLMHELLGNFDLHKAPLAEYEEILNTILVNNGFDALLVSIPKEKRLAAANLLGEFLINSIGDDAVGKLFDGDLLPPTLREQTHALLDYLKSEKFVIDSPAPSPESQIPQHYVQIKGLKAGS